MSTSEEKRDFLLKDFNAVNSIRISYANMRLAVLGTVLTLISGIVTFAKGTIFPDVLGIYAILLLIVFTGIRIISVHNRAIYVFITYLKGIEEELGETGFASQWSRYIQSNQRDGGSHAFVVATRAMNFVISFYVVFDSVFKLPSHLAVLLVTVSIGLLIWNEVHIRKQLDPKGFIHRVSKELAKAKVATIQDKTIDEL